VLHVMTFAELLAEADAPEELVEWVDRLGADPAPDEALARCERAEWLVWIVAAGGGALDDLFVAVRACVERALEELAVGAELLLEPLAELEPGAPADACAAAARRCELAAAEFHGTYRATPPPAYQASCAAAAALARAGEGLAAAAARADFARQERARASAASVGAAPFAFYMPPGRLRFDAGLVRTDAIHQELHFVVAALALAAAEAGRALAGGAEVDDTLADVLRDSFDAAVGPR
jgi:hypothetical protein